MLPSYHPYHGACSLVIPPASFRAQEHFGYAFTVVASRKGGAVRDRTAPLQQLRRSLVYLGAKYAGLLVCGEQVADTEKEQRHWLTSPLFARGLPQQIPAQHGLMHPFFGIQPVRNELRVAKTAAAGSFLESLAQLQRGPGVELNEYLVRTVVK